MNEITKIHLGRQAFTIAIDAHKALQEYLRAIKKHMGDSSEVIEEIELRMAELLTERGIHGNKVVLLKDVDYLKSQLGEPGDFGDDEADDNREETSGSRRLFRDTDNAMLAGVAAGIGKYFSVDPLWVRLAFVVLTFLGTSGMLIYIILWLVMPEAKTSSDRLKMQGKPVTVDALKDVVERADVKGAANRVQHVVGHIGGYIVGAIAKVVLAIVGYGLMLTGIAALLGLTAVGVYWALNHDLVPAGVFPVGASEVALICLAFVAAAMVASFFLITGLAVAKRKWPLPGWALGAIVAVFLASIAVGGALAADAVPKVKERYSAADHSYTRDVPVFETLHVLGDPWVQVRYEQSPTYSVTGNYWGDVAFSELKTSVDGQVLTVDARPLIKSLECHKFCLRPSQVIEVVVRAPSLQMVKSELQGARLALSKFRNQTVKVDAVDSAVVFPNITADSVQAALSEDGVWTFTAAGDYTDPTFEQEVSFYGKSASMTARNIELTFDGTCGVMAELSTGPTINIGRFDTLTINGEKIGAPKDLRAAYDKKGTSPAKCVSLASYLIDNL